MKGKRRKQTGNKILTQGVKIKRQTLYKSRQNKGTNGEDFRKIMFEGKERTDSRQTKVFSPPIFYPGFDNFFPFFLFSILVLHKL
jgi:methylaspartate ammonia-lyase